jgi:two-component system, LytTR family, response regulator
MTTYKSIKAVIVDDEDLGRKNLQLLIERFCPKVEVMSVFENEMEAYNYLINNQIDLVFLDINMPNISGFEFLQLFAERKFEVIFVTAYTDYGIQAIRAKAIDYITKPISVIDLQEAINRVIEKLGIEDIVQTNMISISHTEGTSIVNQNDIVYLEADDYLTKFYLTNHKKIIVSKNIKYYEELLSKNLFIRIHKSFMININFIDSYSKQDGGLVTLKYPVVLPISRRKLTYFLELISKKVKG